MQTASATTSSRAGHMPGHSQIHVKLVYEAGSGRLLGGQLVGRDGVAKRVDIIAAALQARWTVDELAELDLGVRAALFAGLGSDPGCGQPCEEVGRC